jgi:REP element-mobilizing transposase RayT
MIRSNTYTRLHIHFVFAVKYRQALIQYPWSITLHKYIAGILQQLNHHPVSINSMPDHIHILAGINPTQSISDLMRTVKKESCLFINRKKFTSQKFQWQEGYGAFSVSHMHVPIITNYIIRQPQHHTKISFEDEYLMLLKKNQIDYNAAYVFHNPI